MNRWKCMPVFLSVLLLCPWFPLRAQDPQPATNELNVSNPYQALQPVYGAQFEPMTVYADFSQRNQVLDRSVQELLVQLRQAPDEQTKRGLVEQLKVRVAAQFDGQHEARGKQLRELEERVKRLRTEHERRSAAKSV